MKKMFIAASIIFGSLAICLLPHTSHTISAYPENLWTSGGQFGKPSKTLELLQWNRTEYGILWAWLVHDSCTSESAWHVRIEPRCLALYAGGALFGGLVWVVLFGFKNDPPNKARQDERQ